MKKSSILVPVGIILALALSRLVPHMPNFAPITALALFGGVYLSKRYAYVIPLAAMVLSDYLLLYVNPFSTQMFDFSHIQPLSGLWHGTLPAIYASFLISGLVGVWLKNHKSPINVVLSSAFCSFQFFLISNAAVWLASDMYAHTLSGLAQCYLMALPFLQGTLFGDFFYTCTLFGAYELAVRFAKRKTLAVVTA